MTIDKADPGSPPSFRMSEEVRLRGFAIEWLAPGRVLVSKGNVLYESGAIGSRLVRAGTIPLPIWRSLANRVRLMQRALRLMFYNVLPLADGSLFVTYAREVGVVRDGIYRRLNGLVRPCRVLRGAAAIDGNGHVFFGEYLDNAERGPMRVYRHLPGSDDVNVAYTFPPSSIRHVHGIYHDPFEPGLWCLTGDTDGEARMLRTDDGFRTLATIGGGDESWRAVSVQLTREGVWYATDAEFEANRVFHLDRTTGRRSELGMIDGPVYYSATWRGAPFFAVTAELCPSQTGRSATLWTIREGRLSRVVSFDKDRWPVKWLLPGTLHFPRGPGVEEGLYFQAVALEDADARCFRVEAGRSPTPSHAARSARKKVHE